MQTYTTYGTCARQIQFEVENNIVTHVTFIGGCPGNTQGIAKLVVGMHIDDVIRKLKGTMCRNSTSCPDQLAKALEAYKNNSL